MRVTLQREPGIACICAGGFVYFAVNKMLYFSVSGPGPLLFFICTDSYYPYKMTKCIVNVIEVKLPVSFSFSATDCPISDAD